MNEKQKTLKLKHMINESMQKPLVKFHIPLDIQVELYKNGDDIKIVYNQDVIKTKVQKIINKEIEKITKHRVYSIDANVFIPFENKVTLDI